MRNMLEYINEYYRRIKNHCVFQSLLSECANEKKGCCISLVLHLILTLLLDKLRRCVWTASTRTLLIDDSTIFMTQYSSTKHKVKMAKFFRLECHACLLEIDVLSQIWGTPCGHMFHFDCIDKIYKAVNPRCSFCRTEINRIFPLHFQFFSGQQIEDLQNQPDYLSRVVLHDPHRLNQHGQLTPLEISVARLIRMTPNDVAFHLLLMQLLHYLM